MFDIGRVCVKIAGRDAGKKCVVIDHQDNRVLIDGETRRKAVNPAHLEPLSTIVKIKKGASHEEVCKVLNITPRTSQSRKTAPRPRSKREQAQQSKEDKPKEDKHKEDKKKSTTEQKA